MNDIFDFDKPPALYAVMGNPITHSKSPQIHMHFAQQFDINLRYERIHVDVGGFNQAVDSFLASGGQGLNITVPFKLEAWRLADQRSVRVEQAEAANTLWFENQSICADNTDGIGICRDIVNNLGYELKDKKVLILGAGGAVRGILGPLLDLAPQQILIANRTMDKAKVLVDLFDRYDCLTSGGYHDINTKFDIVINGTSSSLHNDLPPLPADLFVGHALAYDMVYADQPTLFMRWAQDHGAGTVADGLGMLVEQAAESFFIWHGKAPDTREVIAHLRKL